MPFDRVLEVLYVGGADYYGVAPDGELTKLTDEEANKLRGTATFVTADFTTATNIVVDIPGDQTSKPMKNSIFTG